MPDRRKTTARQTARTVTASSPDTGNVLRFPTRRRRAFPRPRAIEAVHPALLRRMACIYLDISMDESHEAACRYVNALGWRKGLGEVLNPAIKREIEARGGEVEEETG